MSNTVTIEQGLTAYFKQPSGPSRPGIDWAIRISGERTGTVIVRTYFSSPSPQQSEQQALANKAMLFVKKKLAEGWIPESKDTFLEAE
jgi:hypothetical protein